MRYIDLGEYREPGIGLYSGHPRGAAVRRAVDLDTSDAEREEVVIIIPDDVFAVTASFLSGMLAPSIRELGEETFRELFTFKGPAVEDTLQAVIDYASRRKAAL